MTPLSVVQRLAATSSRIDKEQIIFDAFMHDCHEFFIGARLALDPLISFGIAKVAEISDDDPDPGDYAFADFVSLTDSLRRRQLTGNRARTAIHGAAERCHVATWNQFYRRVLLKDLKVGVTAKTVNKVLEKLVSAYPQAKEHLIPMFGCQLAHDGENPKYQNKIRGRKLLDTKLDGVRILTIMDTVLGTVDLFTRTGQVVENFDAMYASLHGLLPKLPGSMVLDGELISPHGFQHLMAMLQCKEPHDDMAIVRYAVFDLLPLVDFRVGHCARSQRDRHAVLETMQECGLWQETEGRVFVVPQVEIDLDTDDGQQALIEFNRQTIADGFEGIMIKDPDAPYQAKRTVAWLKRKPVLQVSLEIIGFSPGDADGKYKDTLGALVCRGRDGDKLIESNVAGISDDLRHEIYANQSQYLGMVVEVLADRLTLEEGSQIYSLRHPKLKGFRGRTVGEKI